jgi:K+-transporting ATPase KdpF subunit
MSAASSFAPFRFAPTYRLGRSHEDRFDGRLTDGGVDRCSVPCGLGPGGLLRPAIGPGEVVMLWVGMIAAVGLLVYLCVAMFDAENF